MLAETLRFLGSPLLFVKGNADSYNHLAHCGDLEKFVNVIVVSYRHSSSTFSYRALERLSDPGLGVGLPCQLGWGCRVKF